MLLPFVLLLLIALLVNAHALSTRVGSKWSLPNAALAFNMSAGAIGGTSANPSYQPIDFASLFGVTNLPRVTSLAVLMISRPTISLRRSQGLMRA
jgi:hypothetical protein